MPAAPATAIDVARAAASERIAQAAQLLADAQRADIGRALREEITQTCLGGTIAAEIARVDLEGLTPAGVRRFVARLIAVRSVQALGASQERGERKTARRMMAAIMAVIAGVELSERSVHRWLTRYRAGGARALVGRTGRPRKTEGAGR